MKKKDVGERKISKTGKEKITARERERDLKSTEIFGRERERERERDLKSTEIFRREREKYWDIWERERIKKYWERERYIKQINNPVNKTVNQNTFSVLLCC